MKCVNPVRISDKETAGNMMVPCGHCVACRLNYSRMWAIRLMHEKRLHKETCFATLTYDDAHLPKNGTLVKEDVQLFLKRYRENYGTKIRYYLSGEYGDEHGRPHYHAILFGVSREDAGKIRHTWGKGRIHVGDVTQDSCNYVSGYIVKKLCGDAMVLYEDAGIIPEFALMSRKPGIGYDYIKKYADEIRNRKTIIVKGKPAAIPKYYKEKLFLTEAEIEDLNEYQKEYQKKSFDETLDIVKKEGYTGLGLRSINSRIGSENNLKAKVAQKRRKSL